MTETNQNVPAWQELTQIINNWINPQEEYWGTGVIEDANDGSGDGILTFPEGMCEKLGWKEGDTLFISVQDDNSFVISNLTKKQQQDAIIVSKLTKKQQQDAKN